MAAKKHALEHLVKRFTKYRQSGSKLRRWLLEIGRKEICAICNSLPFWLGKPLPMEVDHENGNRTDDRPENLRFLCPNCHSQQTTKKFSGRGHTDETRRHIGESMKKIWHNRNGASPRG
jgi:5-methylcytosine-specific restriction endonuclease McrA